MSNLQLVRREFARARMFRLSVTLAIVLGSASAIQAATASWDANTDPNLAGYLLSYGTQSGVHTSSVDVGNLTTWQLTLTPGQRYYFVVQAYNASAQLSAKSAEVIFDAPVAANRAPTLTQPANQASAENAIVSLAMVASDPDGTPLTYSATGLPPGLSLNTTTGIITGTLSFTSAGSYSVTATVSDGALSASRTFTWTVTNTNRAPTVTQPANQASVQGASVSLQIAASDPDGTALTYSASGLPPGLTISTATGLISGTLSATSAGAYSVTATASDTALSASRVFSWTVTSTQGATTVDLPPLDTTLNVNSTNYSTLDTLSTYTWPANRIANAIVMKFALSQIPANATIQSAVLGLSLVAADTYTAEPTYGVTLHAIVNRNPDITRATGTTADGTTAWTASTCCYGSTPLAQADISAARSAAQVDRVAGFKTWDATSIIQGWLSAPSTNFGLLLNSDSSKGADRYRAFASMEYATVSQRPYLRVTYTVAGADTTAPAVSLSAPVNNAIVSGASAAVSATASDAGGVAGVTFRVDGVALGTEDTTAPYAIAWNTTTVASGTHVLTAVARDVAGNTATSTPVSVTVSNTVPNRAPALTQPANQTTAENAAVSVALVASDPDGNPITYTATGLPAGLSVNSTTGLITGTPTFTSAGAYTVTATASDGLLSNGKTFTWTITNTNRAPQLTQPAGQTSAENATVSLALVATDPDGTALTFGAMGLPASLTINAASGLIAGTLSAGSVGLYIVTVTASDGSLTSSKTFTWGVNNADVPAAGDYDGDSKTDPATYRPTTGEWTVWPSGSAFVEAVPIIWGGGSDIPVQADYDGDRKTDIAVYRPATGTWHVLLSSTNMTTNLVVQWGDSTARPLPLDYDGDGKADLGLLRFGAWEISLSSTNYTTSVIVR